MNYALYTGILGSLIVVTGAAWPETKSEKHPAKSVKNWLFAIGGGVILTIYSILNYREGGTIFFILLQMLIAVADILMMLNTDDRIDAAIIGVSGIALIAWSLFLFEGYNTVLFILGLVLLGLGYSFKNGTLRRNAALTFGSGLIAVFSYMEASWIFFWLNVFFFSLSAYYLIRSVTAETVQLAD